MTMTSQFPNPTVKSVSDNILRFGSIGVAFGGIPNQPQSGPNLPRVRVHGAVSQDALSLTLHPRVNDNPSYMKYMSINVEACH